MLLTTFPRRKDFERSTEVLNTIGLSYQVVDPSPGYRLVGVPAIVLEEEALRQLTCSETGEFYCSGWVNFQPATQSIPLEEPELFPEDRLGTVAIMVLGPCVADLKKIRLIAHISCDLSEIFPYLNAEMTSACFNAGGPSLVFMEGYRMISLLPDRIAVAKADDIVDAWRVLERVRRLVNRCWERRSALTPCYERRRKPPAIEIYKRLPATNCRACGEATCLAFALRLWSGEVAVSQCSAVFDGQYAHLKDALLQLCSGMGMRIEEGQEEL
ncbi:MAG: hypothetical protein EHM23_04125 [Acidobacteria bacterium]|nr:MAG: hypothetical protein EHM23_04125 [Acidobacteriota bacterium]